MKLQTTFVSGALWSSFGNIGQRAFSFFILLILVRILSIKDFGIATTAIMLIQLLQPISRFGIYDYIIQRKDIDEPTKAAAFLTNLFIGCIMSAGLFLLAGPIAKMFSEPELVSVLRLLSPLFLIRSLTCVHEAILAKKFGFKQLAARTVNATIASGLIAVGLAFAGAGVYSLVLQQISNAVIGSVLLYIALPWTPRCSGCWRRIPEVMLKSAAYTISQIMSSLNNTLYGLVIGFMVSTEAAGFFRLAWSGVDLCIQITILPIMQVAQPLFARMQSRRKALGEAYLSVCRHCAALTFPVFGWMAIMGPEVGNLVFSQRWSGTGSILSILCLVVFPATPNYFIGILLNSVGRPDQALRLSATQLSMSMLLAVISSHWGLTGVAIAFVSRAVLTTPLGFYFLSRNIPITPMAVLKALRTPVLASGVTMAVAALTNLSIGESMPEVLVLIASFITSVTAYCAMMVLMDRPLTMKFVSMFGGGRLLRGMVER
jgi:O-antigen/teichoic acid export membrane protein